MSGLKSCNDGDELKSSTKSHDIRLWQIACHEAGHAVIAAILDILGDQSVVTIVPEGCVTGSVEFSRDTSNNAWKQWGMRYTRQAILASYAGPAVSIKLDHGLDLFEEGGWNELDMTGAQDFCRRSGSLAAPETVFSGTGAPA